MKFSCLTTVAPGKTLVEQCAAIAASGCTGIETILFPDTQLERWQQAIRQATSNVGLQTVAVILGGLALDQPDFPAWVREALPAIHETGAAALLTPEYRTQDPLPLFPPYVALPLAAQAQVDAALAEISSLVRKLNMLLLLEPVTQFESRFWRDVETVVQVCERLNNPNVGLALDFHNMNITEANINASLRRAGPWVRHIHLADSNRRLPGEGHIDFASGMATLRAMGYEGWYSFECAVWGNFSAAIKQTVDALMQAEQVKSV